MKVVNIAMSVLSITAYAQVDPVVIAEIAGDAEPRKHSSIIDFLFASITTGVDRKTMSTMIRNYGCHCFPDGDKAIGGKGTPVDDKDGICRKLARCHTCASMDFAGCDPDFGKYAFTLNTGGSSIDCSANTDPCKLNVCECDKQFAIEMAGIWDDATMDTFYWLNKYNVKLGTVVFDKPSICTVAGLGAENNDCCGNYPERRPYSNLAYQCCTDGSVKGLGMCT